jgi:hypothetical protein
LLAVATCLVAGEALADRIDGDWCHPSKPRTLNIQGSAIVTEFGTATNGDYRRHFFTYIIPPTDPEAGRTIGMRQLNEQTMVLSRPDGTEETWQRCDLKTS